MELNKIGMNTNRMVPILMPVGEHNCDFEIGLTTCIKIRHGRKKIGEALTLKVKHSSVGLTSNGRPNPEKVRYTHWRR